LLSRRPAHLPSPQQMQMQMEDRLPRIRPYVIDGAKAVIQLAFARDFGRNQLAIADDLGVGLGRLVNPDDMLFGNDKNVSRRLSPDDFKDESLFVFINFLGRN